MEIVKHDADLYQAESNQRKRTRTVESRQGFYCKELFNGIVEAGQTSLTWEGQAVREGWLKLCGPEHSSGPQAALQSLSHVQLFTTP